MGPLLERFLSWWNGLERNQRPIYAVGAVLLVGLVIGAVVMAGRPQMSMLFGGLSPADQGSVVDELGKLGIRAEADTSGNVFVPSNKVAESRMRLATAKKLPNSGTSGMSVLDSISMTTSPAVEHEKLRAALESDLANSIRTMAGVGNARVHLTMGEDSPFLREAKPPSASVIITEDGAQRLRAEQAESIARLVQFSVSGLTSDRIAISNDKGQILFDGANQSGANGMADKRLSTEIEEARRREQDLQQKLDAAFGAGNTVVSVPVLKLNFDKEKTYVLQRDPSKKPTVKEENKEEMNDANGTPTTGAGAASNIVADAATSQDGSRGYKGSTKREEYVVNETESQIERATGDLKQMSLNVLVNSTKISDPTPVQQYVEGYLGPLTADPENFKANVTSVAFDTTAAVEQKSAAAAVASRDRMQQILSILPIVALTIMGFMVVKALGKTAKAIAPAGPKLEAALPGGGTMALPTEFELNNVGGDRAIESLPDVVRNQMTPEQVIQFQETGELAASLRSFAASMASRPVEIEQIPEKVHVPLEQLKRMAETKPDATANLLKTWILEDRK